MAGARQIVNGPSFTASPYGLWDAVQHPPVPQHWQHGVVYEERCPAGGTIMDECLAVTGVEGPPAGQAALTSTTTQINRGATSFTVYAEFDCSPVGLLDAERIAQDALARVEEWQVSRSFWTGVAGKSTLADQVTVFPHLAANATLDEGAGTSLVRLQTAATVVTGGGPSQDAGVALGVLEQGLADCYHGQGLIHIPPLALPTFQSRAMVHPEANGQLYTANGNRVVVGSGYTGSSPAGAAPGAGQSYIYATGAMFGYQGPVAYTRFNESFDRAENTVRLIARRSYLFGWECCHLSALVDLGVPTT